MNHLLDFVFLAIVVDVMMGPTQWNRQVFQSRLTVVAVYIAAAFAVWIVAHQLLFPMGLENLSGQVYILIILGLIRVTKLIGGRRLWGGLIQECEPICAIAVLTLLGMPLLAHVKHSSLDAFVLPAAAAAIGWLLVSYVLGTLNEQLRIETVPHSLPNRGSLLIIAGLFYWALMGFFDIQFI